MVRTICALCVSPPLEEPKEALRLCVYFTARSQRITAKVAKIKKRCIFAVINIIIINNEYGSIR